MLKKGLYEYEEYHILINSIRIQKWVLLVFRTFYLVLPPFDSKLYLASDIC